MSERSSNLSLSGLPKPSGIRRPILFEILFLLFVVSFFPKLASDSLETSQIMFVYYGLVFLGFVLAGQRLLGSLKSWTVRILILFLLFETARMFYGVALMHPSGTGDLLKQVSIRYVWAPLPWLLYGGFFLLGFLVFQFKGSAHRLLWVLSLCGFVLAITAIPPLLIYGHFGYVDALGRGSFFPGFVYFQPWVEKYLVSRFAHANYVSDVLAFGFFPALGILFYCLQRLMESKDTSKGDWHSALPFLGLLTLFSGSIALAVILILSRGAIISFVSAFLVFLIVLGSKYSFRAHKMMIILALFCIAAGFVVWAANLSATWKEVWSSEKEITEVKEGTSFSTNREAAVRALKIYKHYPLWGAGTKGYSVISKSYATPGSDPYIMRDLKVFCHYLQVLAEEGAGAYLYFLFILTYFLEIGRGLSKTRSRFQFAAGLSLGAIALMILLHAAVKPVMEYFAIAAPVYIFMGASLGVVSKEFVAS